MRHTDVCSACGTTAILIYPNYEFWVCSACHTPNDPFDGDGYDRDGRDEEGLDRDGYDYGGYDRHGYDRQGYRYDDEIYRDRSFGARLPWGWD